MNADLLRRHGVWAAVIAIAVAVAALPAGEVGAQGAVAPEVGVALETGWNNVSYQGETLPVVTALGEAAGFVEAVWHWEAPAQSWSNYFSAAPSIATLIVLEQGESYWLRASRSVTWTQPDVVTFTVARVEVVSQNGVVLSLSVELADTAERRARGLMFRQSLDDEAGMLFLFPSETRSGFWMQNTPVPLSIAFIDEAGVIREIQEMAPLTTELHAPAEAYRWALEVNQGWFAEKGVGVGDVVRLTGS